MRILGQGALHATARPFARDEAIPVTFGLRENPNIARCRERRGVRHFLHQALESGGDQDSSA
jgi:hypothetical protein